MLGLDDRYFGFLWNKYRNDPASLSPDWRSAFDFIRQVYGDPFSLEPLAPRPEGAADLQSYLRRFGHKHAALDPLGSAAVAELPEAHRHAPSNIPADAALYRGTLAVETGHIDDPAIHDWVVREFEAAAAAPVPPDRAILEWLIETEVFDRFLSVKYPGKKRFGSEGADAVLPLLHLLRAGAADREIGEMILGSMHRGRLSILHNVLGMKAEVLFAMFGGTHPFGPDSDLPADVAYHFGHRDECAGVRMTMLPNPSHLEAVNPVAIGYARAIRDEGAGSALAVILHTDASVIGQGVNAELLQMSKLAGFEVGGSLHVVINNQIGFTTDPTQARSSRYCTGAWRAIDSLLIHANGDDIEAVQRAVDLAMRFRARFKRDAVIDLVCYRRNGHNEIDEPRFTQPLYYLAADNKRSVSDIYQEKMIAAGAISASEVEDYRRLVTDRLERAFAATPVALARPEGAASKNRAVEALFEADLRDIVAVLAHVPAGKGHPKMVKLMGRRLEELESGIGWPLAEAMAFGAALRTGISVRLCGQDIARGSFSQRHLAAVDPRTGDSIYPIAALARRGATLDVVNSPLSEYAVLGFEYGYSLGAKDALCVWEAQFGDFANGAQIIIDQFITSGAEKWQQMSNLVVLLPHGLEGQGPEHSSARIERLLQLCAKDNIRVTHPSTPANYYHLLREQPRARAPLFIVTPKMLLRLPAARSLLADFDDGHGFQPVIATGPADARRAIICSGKIAYELEALREATQICAAIIRLEALYPFPSEDLARLLRERQCDEIVWLQEEPENFGAGAWLQPRLAKIAATCGLALSPMIARPESASPAGSFHGRHLEDQEALLRRALKAGE